MQPQNKKEASKGQITTTPGTAQLSRALPSLAKVMLGLESADQKQAALSFIIKAMEVGKNRPCNPVIIKYPIKKFKLIRSQNTVLLLPGDVR